MRKQAKTIALVLMTALFLIPSIAVFAAGPNSALDEPVKEQVYKSVVRRLNLTEEQRKALRAALAEQRKQMRKYRLLLREKRRKLRELFQAETFNEAEAEKIASEISKIQKQILLLRIRHSAKVRKIVGPENFKKMQLMRKRHWQKMRSRRRLK